MNAAPFDYAQERREREATEQRQAAAFRLKVRGVARLLGGRFLDEDAAACVHTIELAPTVHIWARRDWQKKGMIHWGARCPRAAGHACPRVCTAISRPVAATAADLRRRLIPAAQAWCRAAVASAALQHDREHARKARLAELTQAVGPLRESNQVHHAQGFTIRHDDLLGSGFDGRIRAEIDVHSWPCLLMIAKLVAEDARVFAASQPKEDAS